MLDSTIQALTTIDFPSTLTFELKKRDHNNIPYAIDSNETLLYFSLHNHTSIISDTILWEYFIENLIYSSIGTIEYHYIAHNPNKDFYPKIKALMKIHPIDNENTFIEKMNLIMELIRSRLETLNEEPNLNTDSFTPQLIIIKHNKYTKIFNEYLEDINEYSAKANITFIYIHNRGEEILFPQNIYYCSEYLNNHNTIVPIHSGEKKYTYLKNNQLQVIKLIDYHISCIPD